LNKNLTIIYKDKMYEISYKYVIFRGIPPTKEELYNLPLTRMIYDCDHNKVLDENLKIVK